MADNATPRPWKVNKLAAPDNASHPCAIVDSAKGGHVTDFVSIPNADLILAAVNTHDATRRFLAKWREIIGGDGAEPWAQDFDREAEAVLRGEFDG